MTPLAQTVINRAMQTPYRKGHLYHADGSLYMGRYALWETTYFSARVHNIATPDDDRVLHDHPWPFVSIVLQGGYIEQLPPMLEPCWTGTAQGTLQWPDELYERTRATYRKVGSMAYRPARCRHRISIVDPDTWTLFVYGKLVNDWGFYTPQGKVYWAHYLQSGNSTMAKENNSGHRE